MAQAVRRPVPRASSGRRRLFIRGSRQVVLSRRAGRGLRAQLSPTNAVGRSRNGRLRRARHSECGGSGTRDDGLGCQPRQGRSRLFGLRGRGARENRLNPGQSGHVGHSRVMPRGRAWSSFWPTTGHKAYLAAGGMLWCCAPQGRLFSEGIRSSLFASRSLRVACIVSLALMTTPGQHSAIDELRGPSSLAVRDNYCFIADRYNQRIAVFDWQRETFVREASGRDRTALRSWTSGRSILG